MYDFNDVSIKHLVHFTNALTRQLLICISGSYRLLLGAIIIMGGWSAEREFKKKI